MIPHGADQEIGPEELAARLAAGEQPALLDTRSVREFQNARIPGAVLIPYAELADRLTEIPGARDEELIVYCAHGIRAAVAEDFLRSLGWTRLVHLQGDMTAWRTLGLPIERG